MLGLLKAHPNVLPQHGGNTGYEGAPRMDDVGYAWGSDLMSLLDRIEIVADDADAVRVLAQERFAIGKKHGFEITFEGGASGETH